MRLAPFVSTLRLHWSIYKARLHPQRLRPRWHERPDSFLGGVYSNYLALNAALDDIDARGIEHVFCLGDLGAFGPHPDKTVDILREHRVVTLQGNYDNSIAFGLDDCQCGYTDPRDNYYAKLSYDYTLNNTSEHHRRWMRTLPQQLRIKLAGKDVLLCHGSPRQLNEFMWESTTPTHFLGEDVRRF